MLPHVKGFPKSWATLWIPLPNDDTSSDHLHIQPMIVWGTSPQIMDQLSLV